ncbi:MAG: glycosyltransferase family 4 protein [Chloroflexia bacterium]
MRVALDTTFAGINNTGVGRYSRQLAAALRALADRPAGQFDLAVFGPSAHASLHRLRDLALENPLATQAWLPMRLAAYRPDILHSTAFVGPLWGRGRFVLTFHDLIYHHYPADYDGLWLRVIEALAPRALRRARAVIAISRCTADDLARNYRVPAGKIHVVPIGIDSAFFAPVPPARVAAVRERFGLTAPYVLHTGALVRRKNLAMLVRAFSRYCAEAGDDTTLLALTGRPAPGMPGVADLLSAIESSPARARIRLLGHAPGPDLPALYAGARLVVYPTEFEGQGLPPLEAMAVGTPVLASSTPAVAEVAAPAAYLADPHAEPAWSAALARLLPDSSLRASMVERGLSVASNYTWPRCAEATLAIYECVLRGG